LPLTAYAEYTKRMFGDAGDETDNAQEPVRRVASAAAPQPRMARGGNL
jgi:hypothetical protein